MVHVALKNDVVILLLKFFFFFIFWQRILLTLTDMTLKQYYITWNGKNALCSTVHTCTFLTNLSHSKRNLITIQVKIYKKSNKISLQNKTTTTKNKIVKSAILCLITWKQALLKHYVFYTIISKIRPFQGCIIVQIDNLLTRHKN